MRMKFTIALLFVASFSLGQERGKGFIDLNQRIDFNFNNTESNLNFGFNYFLKKISISAFSSYAYGGVSKKVETHNPFELDYHLLGGGIKFKFREEQKLYTPTLKLSGFTEISSKYRGKKLEKSFVDDDKDIFFLPTLDNYVKTSYWNGIISRYSYHYISTPLIASLFFENEFKIQNEISLHVGIGYLLRLVRYTINEWSPDMSEPVIIVTETHKLRETINGKVQKFNYLSFEIGVSYTFPLKKTSKSE